MDTKEYNVVTMVDYDGQPLHIRPKKTKLVTFDDDDEISRQASAKSPMPGTIVKVNCEAGDVVAAGTILATLESMKMEYQIKATHDVVIDKVLAHEGQFVN